MTQFSTENLEKLRDRYEFLDYVIAFHEKNPETSGIIWPLSQEDLVRRQWEGIHALKMERNKLLTEIDALTYYLG